MDVLAHFSKHGVQLQLNPNQTVRATGAINDALRAEIQAQKANIIHALKWQEFEALLAIVAPAYNTPPREVDSAREGAWGDLEAALVSYREMAAQLIVNERVAVEKQKASNPAVSAEVTTPPVAKQTDVDTRAIGQAKKTVKRGSSDTVRDGAVSLKQAENIAKLPELERENAIENPDETYTKEDQIYDLKMEVANLQIELERMQDAETLWQWVIANPAEADAAEMFKRQKIDLAELGAIRTQHNTLMNENAALKQQCQLNERRMKKFKKELEAAGAAGAAAQVMTVQ